MEELELRKNELKFSEKEWFSTLILTEMRKRKGMQTFQLQTLRNLIKEGGDEVIKKFGEKYRELRVEPNRNNIVEALQMGNQSNARLWHK